ncbi:hypothetical protein Bca52824_073417 [Brassica carinata]|uniref:Uncharacterized protein n=2 Tax=Brassica TaxID=3705 RepID=A0A8S9N161_BRACR|nr:hypothetical protein F2Q69_00053038 [Brassica cretica]KAG2266338.1 hypothetical protein Bca52824_073417 [Brassica carinata]
MKKKDLYCEEERCCSEKKDAVKKKRDATRKSEVVAKKRKVDGGVHGGFSANPNKRAQNCERETASPPDPQRDLFSELTTASPSQPTSKPQKLSQPKNLDIFWCN